MEYLVKEYWYNGKIAEFGPFHDYETAFDFVEKCQVHNADQVIERVEIVEADA